MTYRRLFLVGFSCLAVACAKSPADGNGGLNDPCLTNADCKSPFICLATKGDPTAVERCELDANATCDKGKERCNGLTIETCGGDAGDGIHGNEWKATQTCTTRCDWEQETQSATCAAQVCSPGATQCFATTDNSAPTIIQQCDSRGTAWVDAQVCPTSCAMVDGQAECSTPVCPPFTYQCKPGDPTTRQQCDSEGTAWRDESCPDNTTCIGGTCLPIVCAQGDEMCDSTGTTVMTCNDSGTAFIAKQVCANGCVFDTGTKTASCPAPVCSPFATQCDPANADAVQQCNQFGTAWVDQAIPTGEKCVDGEYVPQVCQYAATTTGGSTTITADTQCAGAVLEQCDPQENGWDALELCQYGCGKDAKGNPACTPPLCAQGQSTCGGTGGNALETCDQNGISWDFVQYCPAGCSIDSTKTPPVASCNPTACTPLATQCGTDPATGVQYVEVCQDDGSQFVRTEDCAQACTDGACTFEDAQCATSGPASQRCMGSEVEQCELLSNGATEWRFSERCLAACENGACTAGGSAGCAGGALPTTICGAPNRQVITLHPLLASPTTEVVPCDGVSRVLVYSDPIVSAAGVAVPDGTLVSFSTSGTTANLLASADADPTTPGLQRPTLFGRATVLVQAPPSCSGPTQITVNASLGGRATGAVSIQFGPPTVTTPPTQTVYVAEDFSNSTYEDRAATSAQWNTSIGAAVALPPYNFGTGVDGNYEAAVVTDPKTGNKTSVHSLDQEGYAPSWNVSRMGPKSVYVSDASGRAPSMLAQGDEVLLMTLWSGTGDTIGTWEYHRVVSTTFRSDIGQWKVLLSTPIEHVFGNNGANLDFTNNRTVIQRVPNFQNVTIDSSASITMQAPSWNADGTLGGGTGVLAFRVQGTLRVLGTIDMSGRGFPWGNRPTAPPSTATDRLVLGQGGAEITSGLRLQTYEGGGLVLFTAKNVTFEDASGNPADSSALITVASSGEPTGGLIEIPSTGGVIVAKSAGIIFGTQPAATPAVPRLETGNQGHALLTYATVDNDPLATPPPANPPVDPPSSLTVLHAGSFGVKSTVAYSNGSGTPPNTIFSTTLEGVIGGEGGTSVVAPMPSGGLTVPLPSLTVHTSADDGTTFGDSDLGRVLYDLTSGNPRPPPPYVGHQFEWVATLSNLDDQPVYLSGVAFKLVLQ